MSYLKRNIDKDLQEWKNSVNRKPLLLRGARQVGKSSAVRELGQQFEFFVEINFENKDHASAKKIFEAHSNPKIITDELSVMFEKPIVSGKTLLFLDEIQSCPEAISALRYFYEQMPELHVIAAGSLLEFALQKIPSFGVGRIRSMYMYPFSFEEFLQALGRTMLLEKLQLANPQNPLSEELHKQLKEIFLRFIAIGGMPEVVAKYATDGSLLDCQNILDELIETLFNDFSKYKQQVPVTRLEEVFSAIIAQTGQKFTYSAAATSANQVQIKESIELLKMAGLVYSATHTSANGLPLGAETNSRYRKLMLLDTGIYQRFLRLNLANLLLDEKIEQINKGALAEMFVGTELVKVQNNRLPADLYYWQREKGGSTAEVDYVIQIGQNIIPVEVKAGTKGAMQSMFLFLAEKQRPYGIRCSMENFGEFQNIKIYPLYAVANFQKIETL
ncbi:MAG: AAA family ATPase [Dysgonamonadaceae bacterium]|jgi:predicted AAA+ superfamily ATPase|nr:AAA family ATPase [Dysgonamonadaceae bacterium]